MTDYDLSIHHNPDAHAWAKFFIKTTKDMDCNVFRDEEYMIGWFANAMMAMYDHLNGLSYSQERLGKEFEEVLYKNLDKLYEEGE